MCIRDSVYFGDLHVHTKHSFDAYIFGTTATPDDAYKYAKGNSIKHPLGYDMQLREPLDFYAVTDHGFLLGSVEGWADPNNGKAETEPFHNINAPENLNQESIAARSQLFQNYVRNIAQFSNIWTRTVAYFTGDTARGSTLFDVDIHRTAWIFKGFGDFTGLHGVQKSEVSQPLPPFVNGMLSLKKPLLDPSYRPCPTYSWSHEESIPIA